MTTIDRAAREAEFSRRVAEIAETLGLPVISIDEVLAKPAIRKPDQKGEAAVFGDSPHVMSRPSFAGSQPAPEAGKLPSEEARPKGHPALTALLDADLTSADLELLEHFEPELIARFRALLSPAQPHDVPAGNVDGDHPRIWLEPKADNYGSEGRLWCQDDVWEGGVEYVRASRSTSGRA